MLYSIHGTTRNFDRPTSLFQPARNTVGLLHASAEQRKGRSVANAIGKKTDEQTKGWEVHTAR